MVDSQQKILLQIAKMERPWSDIEIFGARIFHEHESLVLLPGRDISVSAPLVNLAQGLLRSSACPAKCREWALIVLFFVDFEDETHVYYDLLMGALHDVSAGEPIDPLIFDAARSVIREYQENDSGST